MTIKFNPEVSTANILVIILASIAGLSMFTRVEGQVIQNAQAIEKQQKVIEQITQDITELKTNVAIIANDGQHASKMMQEIKVNQKQIITLLSQG
jgi:GTP cyclohydrolase I|tara:strand:+ start:163 stop:447 length:285 start_codon:yes stop_codon:yes gene_type:complete